MSTVNVQPTTSARSAVEYALYGTGERRWQHLEDGTNRAARYTCSMESPEATVASAKQVIVARAEQVSAAFHRFNEMYTYTQNFSPEEFDVNNPEHIQRVHDLGVKLAKRMNSADFLVVTHTDSAGGHLHNHIYVVNHDNLTGKSLSRCRSWSRGLRQVNDQLMCDEGCQVLPDPQRPKPDWDLRRGSFAEDGFEQVLGDKVMEALLDEHSVNREAFEQVLAEHGVRLRVTDRDGWTYSMRRADNGKWGRRKASSLCDEFTAKGAEEIFALRQRQQVNDVQKGEQHERSGKNQAGTTGLGDINSLDVEARRRRGAGTRADEVSQRSERLSQGDGRGADGSAQASGEADLAAARAALEDAARRRDEEQAERDREDAHRRREAAKRQASRDAERRQRSERLRAASTLDDEAARSSDEEARSTDDEPDYGF